MIMNIYFVRHGQTDWNIQNRLQGSSDIPLNSTGIKQAHILADKLRSTHFDYIISSPLNRALNTANIINEHRDIPLITDTSLLERSFGCLEGVKGDEYDKNLFWDYSKNYQYKDVEPIQYFFVIIHRYLDSLIKTYPEKTLLLVSHNGVNIATNCYFNGFPNDMNLLNIKLDNCSFENYDSSKIISEHKTNFER